MALFVLLSPGSDEILTHVTPSDQVSLTAPHKVGLLGSSKSQCWMAPTEFLVKWKPYICQNNQQYFSELKRHRLSSQKLYRSWHLYHILFSHLSSHTTWMTVAKINTQLCLIPKGNISPVSNSNPKLSSRDHFKDKEMYSPCYDSSWLNSWGRQNPLGGPPPALSLPSTFS